MTKIARIQAAEQLVTGFAERTGIARPATAGTRYLWTDAFGVLALLGLHELTGRDEYLGWALRLVEQVHHTLGRHRDDDSRTGWLSGLDDADGERHPTCGGLRIGKPLRERGPGEPYDERLEWDRDGQYFHYLTKWMHALNRVTRVTGDACYNDWALELADVAHRAFAHEALDGGRGIWWKMSIDLTRPVVPSMGHHDALDGFVTYSRLEASRTVREPPGAPDLGPAEADLRHMCESGGWATGDVLGIGGLLADAGQLVQMIAGGVLDDVTLARAVLRDAQHSLYHFADRHRLDDPAASRLAFRELGLSIGLQAVPSMRSRIARHPERIPENDALLTLVESIARYTPLIEHIEQFWLDPANRAVESWTDHRDINDVMLATSLVPHVYLLDDPGPPAGSDDPRPQAGGLRDRVRGLSR